MVNEEPEEIDPVDILDDPELLCPPKPKKNHGGRTNKHKKKWHDTMEAPAEDEGFFDSEEGTSGEIYSQEHDFRPTITHDEMSQSHPSRRSKLQRSCIKQHLLTASACLSLARAQAVQAAQNGITIIDTGVNIENLGESKLFNHDLFNHHPLVTS